MNSDDGCVTLLKYLMPLNCTPKIVKVVNIVLCIFYHIKKEIMHPSSIFTNYNVYHNHSTLSQLGDLHSHNSLSLFRLHQLTFIHVCVFSSMQSCHNVNSCDHHHTQDTEQFHHHKDPSCQLPFYKKRATPTPPPLDPNEKRF